MKEITNPRNQNDRQRQLQPCPTGQDSRRRAVRIVDAGQLRERQGAQRSWEVTQVNEMLTQMESFHGIFIASTNLMDSLDAAAMRRFDARIHLGYLRPEAAWEMFNWLMHAFKLINTGEARTVLDQLNNLTPGDFAVVERHCRLDPVASGAELVGRLLKLSESKQGIARRPIGFVA